MSGSYYLGIDPGVRGAMAVVDQAGHYLAAARWSKPRPRSIFHRLEALQGGLQAVYLEQVRVFPRAGMAHVTQGQSLLVNQGIWQGWLIALALPYRLIDPATWQSQAGLFHWRKKLAANPRSHSPLTMARQVWPQAPYTSQPDDGIAVALILADLARRHHAMGLFPTTD